MAEKRAQLRRCSGCQKVGHNKARCTIAATPITASKSAPEPLKFFVHHVVHASQASPHILNLKNDRPTVWQNIHTADHHTPTTLFHSYHQKPLASFTNFAAAPLQRPSFTHLLPPDAPYIIKPALDLSAQKYFSIPLFIRKFTSHFQNKYKQLQERLGNLPWPRLAPALSIAIIVVLISTTIPGPALGYYRNVQATKANLTQDSMAGFMALQTAAVALKEGNVGAAKDSTGEALTKFNNALTVLEDNRLLTTLTGLIPVVRGEVQNREKILLAGQEIAVGNSYLLGGLNAIDSTQTGTPRLKMILTALGSALPNYQKAAANLASVDEGILPTEYQSAFVDFRTVLTAGLSDLASIHNFADALQEIVGEKGTRRYLLMFQNPDEIRPTGGFLGSFALVEIRNGELKTFILPPGGSYDLQGQLEEYVTPPTPLLLSNKRWEFQDANWFPDFPASAEKIAWFYAHSREITPDGVIAINATVLPRLLALLGPVVDQTRSVTLDSQNALTIIQKIVEEGPEKKSNRPKQILTDTAGTLLNKLKNLNSADLLTTIAIFENALSQKDIQAYFIDPHAQELVRTYGWSGEIKNIGPQQDYLFVVNTNIQGQKSDRSINQKITHQAVVGADGSLIDTVTIEREHKGSPEKLYNATNIDYLRVYVPAGSELIAARGFSWPDEQNFRVPEKWFASDTDLTKQEQETKIDNRTGTRVTNEFGKTAFGNWVITEPNTVSRVSFTYRLPFNLKTKRQIPAAINKLVQAVAPEYLNYQLVVQKQSGNNTEFDSQIIFPDETKPVWGDGQNIILAKNGAVISPLNLTSDSIWSLIIKP